MGTDIHSVVQVRKDGKWVNVGEGWRDRNYWVFGLLANVRNGYGFAGCDTGDALRPIAMPRGLPTDMGIDPNSTDVRIPRDFDARYHDEKDRDYWLGDHTHSYLYGFEICDKAWHDQVCVIRGSVPADTYDAWKASGEDFPGGWCSSTTAKTVSEAEYAEMKASGFKPEPSQGFISRLYVNAEWRLPPAKAMGESFMSWVKEIEGLCAEHGGQNVRMVFGFDSRSSPSAALGWEPAPRWGKRREGRMDSVFPVERKLGADNLIQECTSGGLTKRELFAAMAMQGFVAANYQGIPMTGEELARRSCGCADALIAELAKKPETP